MSDSMLDGDNHHHHHSMSLLGCCLNPSLHHQVAPDEGASSSTQETTSKNNDTMSEQDKQDYQDLQHLARKREIKVTIQKSTQAGVAAGLSVMAGVLVAGPVGAAVGGAVGTAVAVSISKNVVGLYDLLEQTPVNKRGEIIALFKESFQEEFLDTLQKNPEIKLLVGGMTILGVLRYMIDRDMLQDDQLETMDGILRKIF